MSARTYEQSAPAPVTEPMVGQTCVHCLAPFALGESIKDLFVYKFGELDWIETFHVNCVLANRSEDDIILEKVNEANRLSGLPPLSMD